MCAETTCGHYTYETLAVRITLILQLLRQQSWHLKEENVEREDNY